MDVLEKEKSLQKMSTPHFINAMERILIAIQKLSQARCFNDIVQIVKHEARALTNADGATFVLRDQHECYYLDEEAIAPLWKGKRFPLKICISGWVILNCKPVIIPDVYKDSRIPHEAYKSTFVKSLVMVPIRTIDPIGAIGNYWGHSHDPSEEEIKLLQTLADSTAVAIKNIQLYDDLKQQLLQSHAQEKQARLLSTKLQISLNEKDTLLKEVYHRVKNNFQVILSTLNLQTAYLEDKKTKNALEKNITRIKSMAIIHNILYQNENLTTISLNEYIQQLFNFLQTIYQINYKRIQFSCDIHVALVDLNQAIPLGLIINELISNALLHAFPNQANGHIYVLIKQTDHGLNLIINDNGIGIGKQINFTEIHTFGLQFVCKLIQGLGGSVQHEEIEGTRFNILIQPS